MLIDSVMVKEEYRGFDLLKHKGYLIINKLHLHGGERLIVYKEVID